LRFSPVPTQFLKSSTFQPGSHHCFIV
jgi:hypothetical protein